jgi:hypothetical protein
MYIAVLLLLHLVFARGLSSFRMRRRIRGRKTLVVRFSACGAVCLFVSILFLRLVKNFL